MMVGGANSNACNGCGHELRVGHQGGLRQSLRRRQHRWCQLCEILVPKIAGQRTDMIASPESAARVREMLGNPRTSPTQVWGRIARLQGASVDGDYDWMYRQESAHSDWKWISSPPSEWSLDEEDISLISSYRGTRSTAEAAEDSRIRLRKLQRGGVLPDGSHLCWSAGSFILDGCRIKVPYQGLLEILRKPPAGVRLDKIDWRLLLFTIDIAETRLSGIFRETHIDPDWDWDEAGGPTLRRSEVNLVIHPADLLISKKRGGPNFSYGLRTFGKTAWMERWLEYRRDRSIVGKKGMISVPVSLIISRGRLQMRVRRDCGWRKIKVKSDPRLWARIATWSLSPPNHDDRRRLNCIQQYLFAESDSPVLEDSESRGIAFLRSILDSTSRASVDMTSASPERAGRFRVTGSTGLSYSVFPGRGDGGTRFVVESMDHHPDERRALNMWGLHRTRSRICIAETPAMKRLSVGDAIGAAILSLLDDKNSQNGIHTLHSHISSMSHILEPRRSREEEQVNDARMLLERVNRNLMIHSVRRCRDSFPMLWSALLRMPLGERLTFTAIRRGEPNITFDGCDTRFETTCATDRSVIYRMLRASGWMRDRREEELRGQMRIYIRIGTGVRDLADGIREFSGILQQGLGIDEEGGLLPNPIHSYFERHNPGISALLPGSEGLID